MTPQHMCLLNCPNSASTQHSHGPKNGRSEDSKPSWYTIYSDGQVQNSQSKDTVVQTNQNVILRHMEYEFHSQQPWGIPGSYIFLKNPKLPLYLKTLTRFLYHRCAILSQLKGIQKGCLSTVLADCDNVPRAPV